MASTKKRSTKKEKDADSSKKDSSSKAGSATNEKKKKTSRKNTASEKESKTASKKKTAASSTKKSASSKRSSSSGKTGGKTSGKKKETSASQKKTAKKGAKKATASSAGKKKSKKEDFSSGPAKLKVRVTREDTSGIEEDMEEAHYSQEQKEKSSDTPRGENKKKKKTSSVAKKESDSGKQTTRGKKKEKEKKASVADKVGVAAEAIKNKTTSPVPDSDKTGEWKKRPIEEETESKGRKKEGSRSINLYRKISLTFILLTLVLVGAVVYFSLAKAEIIVTTKEERVSDSLMLEVYDKKSSNSGSEAPKKGLEGVVDRLDIQKTESYKSTGEESVEEEVTGTVEVTNNYSQDQPLVASTRLLGPGDRLYRTEETVTVPAGGSVEVEVYADEPGPETALGPANFTIPGLWAGLQDDIYAESKEDFVYHREKRRFVAESDIEDAVTDVKRALREKAESKFGEEYLGYDEVMYELRGVEVEVDEEEGAETNAFKATAQGKVHIVAFDGSALQQRAKDSLSSILSKDRKLAEFDKGEMDYSLESYDEEEKRATLKVDFSGSSTLKNTKEIIDRRKIAGLNKRQLEDYLDGIESISGYEIEFSPSFVNKTPSLVDKINIEIREPDSL